MADAACGPRAGEGVYAEADAGTAVDAHDRAEAACLLVHRPVVVVSEVQRVAERGQHDAPQAKVQHCAAQFQHGLVRVLHGDDAQRVERVADAAVAVGHVVVVAAADPHCVVRLLHEADGERLGREEDGRLHPCLLLEGDDVLAGSLCGSRSP